MLQYLIYKYAAGIIEQKVWLYSTIKKNGK